MNFSSPLVPDAQTPLKLLCADLPSVARLWMQRLGALLAHALQA